MPPMLNVAITKLMSCREQQVLACETRFGMYQRHHILQLIPESERAPRLIIATARPEAARKSLVQQPTVYQKVDRGIRGLYMNCAEGLIPILPDLFERAPRSRGSSKALHYVTTVIQRFRGPAAARRALEE